MADSRIVYTRVVGTINSSPPVGRVADCIPHVADDHSTSNLLLASTQVLISFLMCGSEISNEFFLVSC